MFNNLFGKKETSKEKEVIALYENSPVEAVVDTKPVVKTKKGYDPVILQIHNEFKTSADRLLQQALAIVNETKSPISEEKASLLKKHGFNMTKEALEQQKIEKETQLSKAKIETITYYKQNYPFNKFIFPEQVREICKKYNLVFGQASDYKGFVPEKNLKEIDNFKLKEDDYCYYMGYLRIPGHKIDITRETYEKNKKEEEKIKEKGDWGIAQSYYSKNTSLEICAPIHDMNTKNKRVVDGYKLENIPLDPVVLHPVRGGGYLVLTAWGDEASDPIIQNEILN